MIQDAKDFINDWVRENINAEAYTAYGDDSRARELAERCRSGAKEAGISENDLDAAVDDMWGGGNGLMGFMADAMEAATDAEVRRLADKDN